MYSLAFDWWRLIRVATSLTVVFAVFLMVWRFTEDPTFRRLSPDSFHWPSLFLAGSTTVLAQLLYHLRWYWLLRVVQAPLTWMEAMAAGLVAQLLGAMAIGSAGSDVFRGISTGRSRRIHRPAIVATILADRVIGLYSLFCVAAWAALISPETGQWQAIRTATLPILWTAVVAGGAIIITGLVLPTSFLLAWTRSFPRLHRHVMPMLEAVHRFRERPAMIAGSIVNAMAVHALGATSLWLIARGLRLPHPSLSAHCLIMPLATYSALLPLPMAGLGPVELIIDSLYQAAVPMATGVGFIVALAGRMLGLTINALMVAAFLPLSWLVHSFDNDITRIRSPGIKWIL
ncbi:MAG: lysylphosphatidylglycerol synthase transmembrane domain-containing protein [Planctomycetota bacterium]|nr:lysylphosphatidylglycerol synthase transmembrane domain-containing protein [Planctomycetota bacterium]